jgi:hypothetical protein
MTWALVPSQTHQSFVCFWFCFWFSWKEKEKKKIGDEEVDIQHRMDNRCVFCHSVFCLKKKTSSFRFEKNVFCSEKVLREITKTPTVLLQQKN